MYTIHRDNLTPLPRTPLHLCLRSCAPTRSPLQRPVPIALHQDSMRAFSLLACTIHPVRPACKQCMTGQARVARV